MIAKNAKDLESIKIEKEKAQGRNAGYIQITRKCNNECAFCSNPAFEKPLEWKELTRRLLFYKNNGLNEVVFSGGEPTESEFLPDAIRYAGSLGLGCRIVTNGVNLSVPSYVKRLVDAGLRHIHISLHSHISEDSDRLTNRPGHFERTWAGIGNAIEAGIKVDINTTLNAVNAKYLSGSVKAITARYPAITHFVFNNLDLGESDKQLTSKARKNTWVIAKLTDLELELSRTVSHLRASGRTCRIERVPLCYMNGFEEFSTETRKIVKSERYRCIFIEKDRDDMYIEVDDPSQDRRHKDKCCSVCMLHSICAGLCIEYLEVFQQSPLFPVFKDPKEIENRIQNG